MKKALIIANMLFASSTVFGMYNLSPIDPRQSSGGVRQVVQNPDIERFHLEKEFKEVINKDLKTRNQFLSSCSLPVCREGEYELKCKEYFCNISF